MPHGVQSSRLTENHRMIWGTEKILQWHREQTTPKACLKKAKKCIGKCSISTYMQSIVFHLTTEDLKGSDSLKLSARKMQVPEQWTS